MERLGEAEGKLNRAITLLEGLGSSRTIRLADALNARADFHAAKGDRRGELEDSRRAYALLKRQVNHDTNGPNTSFGQSQQRSARELFGIHALRLAGSESGDPASIEEAFAASQYSLTSRTGEALRRATVRMSLQDSDLARYLRQREDTLDALRQANALLAGALSQSHPNAGQEDARLQELVHKHTQQLRELDNFLANRFPKYGEFAHPRPVSIQAVQTVLSGDEAVLMTVVTQDRLMLWAIDRETAQPAVVPTKAQQINELAERLRASIDRALRHRARTASPEFDLEAAKRLYEIVAAPVSKVLEGKKHIIFLPEGPLQSIPLHVLAEREGDWLIRRYAVTTEPSLTGFVAARESKQHSLAPLAFLGVGATDFAGFGEVADAGVVAYLQALPKAASELRRMSAMFPQDEVKLAIDREATKAGFLASSPGNYRMIAFATHALTVQETPGSFEPAIVLFPDGNSVADSLLTASDVAALNLDADLVILSACNTAAPEAGPDAEGLSGLARAFILAGSRAMLVSHWSVPDAAAPLLTSSFLAAIQKDPATRKAEALRSAILELLETGEYTLTHPAYWAPFVVVGE
jgi:CHAT domain-containing protein